MKKQNMQNNAFIFKLLRFPRKSSTEVCFPLCCSSGVKSRSDHCDMQVNSWYFQIVFKWCRRWQINTERGKTDSNQAIGNHGKTIVATAPVVSELKPLDIQTDGQVHVPQTEQFICFCKANLQRRIERMIRYFSAFLNTTAKVQCEGIRAHHPNVLSRFLICFRKSQWCAQ